MDENEFLAKTGVLSPHRRFARKALKKPLRALKEPLKRKAKKGEKRISVRVYGPLKKLKARKKKRRFREGILPSLERRFLFLIGKILPIESCIAD